MKLRRKDVDRIIDLIREAGKARVTVDLSSTETVGELSRTDTITLAPVVKQTIVWEDGD